jgi:hypothetical protein
LPRTNFFATEPQKSSAIGIASAVKKGFVNSISPRQLVTAISEISPAIKTQIKNGSKSFMFLAETIIA